MGKKNKNNKFDSNPLDYFNQMDEFLSGKRPIDGFLNPNGSNSLLEDIDDLIYNRKRQTPSKADKKEMLYFDEALVSPDMVDEFEASQEEAEENTGFSFNDLEFVEGDDSEEYAKENEEESNEDDFNEEDEEMMMRTIDFTVLTKFDRLVINDYISPTSFSFKYGINKDLNPNVVDESELNIDADEMASYYDMLINYIISLKHPSAIYTMEDFKKKFKVANEIAFDRERFRFMHHEDFEVVLAYDVSTEYLKDFAAALDSYNMTPNQILQTLVSLSYACGSINDAFFVEDDDYVDAFYASDYNYRDEFVKLFNSQFNEDDERTEIPVLSSVKDIQIEARDLIQKLTGQPYFDEDEDDDELMNDLDEEDDEDDIDEDEEVEVSKEAFEEFQNSKDENDDDSLMADDMEEVSESESEKLIVNVHRKTDK